MFVFHFNGRTFMPKQFGTRSQNLVLVLAYDRLAKQAEWIQPRVTSREVPGTEQGPSSSFLGFPMRLLHTQPSPPTEVCDIFNQAAPYHILRDQQEDLHVGGRVALRWGGGKILSL
jgi:hypothetical protein